MRWAFWRARERSERISQEVRPLPDDVGLTSTAPAPAASADHDEDDDGRTGRAGSPFSGASPDAARTPPREPQPPAVTGPLPQLDELRVASSGAVVTALVRAVLVGAPDGVRTALAPVADPTAAWAAAAAATGALAARLPALSGLDDALTADEDEDDLLHAYADLLAERAEGRRASVAPDVPREHLAVVAHLAAAAALGDAASEPSLLVLPGIPGEQQLLAGGVLLAQTSADGGGDPSRLTAEVAALFG